MTVEYELYRQVVENATENGYETVRADKDVRRLKRRAEALRDDMDKAESEEEERRLYEALTATMAGLRSRIKSVHEEAQRLPEAEA
jgi:predicted nuclease with TOPRIM domain